MTVNRRDLTSQVAKDTFDVEAEAKRRGLEPYQVRATQAVGDRLVRDIVADARRGLSQSASMIPDRQRSEPSPTGNNGWVEPAPLSSPPGISTIDAMCEAQDRADRAAVVRVRIETELVEELMSNKIQNKATTEYNPFSRQRMGHDEE
jgi:hypothetical protein